jgi:hypothetical protein
MITQPQTNPLSLFNAGLARFMLLRMIIQRRAISFNRARIARTITLLVMIGLLLGLSTPALAQGGGGLTSAIEKIVTAITDIIQGICIGAGILGLSIWGIGKVVRPYFPQVAGLTQNYIGEMMIGIAVVFIASQVVEGLAQALA